MPGFDLLLANLISPIVLAFVLGAIAGFIRSELELPEPVLKLLSIYLLFSIGLVGGRELALAGLAAIAPLVAVAALLTIVIPIASFVVLRSLGRFDVSNAAAVAAHYGSVSSVTFFAAMAFARAAGTPAEGYMTAVVAIMEWGVIVALMLARWSLGRASGRASIGQLVADTLRGRGILLLSGGMVIGALAGDRGWSQIAPFYEHLFRGILMLFLLEMGMTAARQVRDFATVGRFMTGFAIVAPLVFGTLGVVAGHVAGLGTGGAFVLGAVCASASYIDAPAACRAALPEASPGIYLTASLGITFPFNLLAGLPLLHALSQWLGGA
ncbi:sodium-dependent bicarbonate transport family permease [Elioraea sp.]|uniref:sodium-dependent bicarbonate transport family permease n=1 Tax=Elioraea sp. TaxID=2185103 RepID=UPI0025BEED31|nr:sodium-dependent bicarbonate transport family permease [Elioraea sp.]